jgi:AraC-like DNA-binding protein
MGYKDDQQSEQESFSRFLPVPPLATSIEAYYFSETKAPAQTNKERCLPNGQVAIVINLGHEMLRAARQPANQLQSFRGGVLHGAFSQCSVIDPSILVATVSICFKPGGARLFLPMPATELTNQVVELSHLFGTTALELRERLLAAQTDEERVRILDYFLLACTACEQSPHPAIAFALASFQDSAGSCPVSEVTEQLGLRPKRFIHLFEEAVGLTPKVFCRLLRFQEVLSRIENEQRVCWTELALDCGYFDQAHFIHDFQTFSGLTPQAYLKQRGPFRNHVPLPD